MPPPKSPFSLRALILSADPLHCITTTAELAAFCEDAASQPFVAVDTEFAREKTYWPQLCLVQVAFAGQQAVIDPLAARLDLKPLFALMQDRNVIKVLHSARQDIEIFHALTGHIPQPVFDTQIAASVLGFGDSVGYERLVREMLGQTVDKAARYSDWTARPLPERQLQYALEDVTHLRDLYPRLRERLVQQGREDWLREDLETLCSPATYAQEPEQAFRRLKLKAGSATFQATARALAVWREETAQRRNLPRGWVLKDDALVRLASELAHGRADLGLVTSRLPKALLEMDRELPARLLEARQGLPRTPREEAPAQAPDGVVELLRVWLRTCCARHGVAERLVAAGSDLERLATEGEASDVPCLHGWRREVFGTDALRLLAGQVLLGIDPATGQVVAVDRTVMPAEAGIQ